MHTSHVTQPTLPPEGDYTDLERIFISEQPRRLWPINQNSNLGALRKVLTGEAQKALDTLVELSAELSVRTSTGYLGRWEAEVGLPVAPTGRTVDERRASVLSRKARGVFGRDRRRRIVEDFIASTLGPALSLTPEGLSLTSDGLSLFSGVGAEISTLYRIYENVPDFSYEVIIDDSVDVDVTGLTRELARITPGHISFTITETPSILSYTKWMQHTQPVGWWRLASTADSSGNGMTLTGSGGVTVGGHPSLLAVSGDAATNFDGADDYLSVSAGITQLLAGMRDFTIKAWIKATAIPSASGIIIFVPTSPIDYFMRLMPTGYIDLGVRHFSGTGYVVKGTPSSTITTGSTYQVVGIKRGKTLEIYVNGIRADSGMIGGSLESDLPEIITPSTANPFIGGTGADGTTNFNGVLDEINVYDRAWSPEEVMLDYNTGRAVV